MKRFFASMFFGARSNIYQVFEIRTILVCENNSGDIKLDAINFVYPTTICSFEYNTCLRGVMVVLGC